MARGGTGEGGPASDAARPPVPASPPSRTSGLAPRAAGLAALALLGGVGGALLALRDPLAYTVAVPIRAPDAAAPRLDPTGRAVLEAVVQAQGLDGDAEFGSRPPDLTDRLLARLGQAPGEAGEDAALRALRDSVAVTREAPGPLVTVAVTAASADKAARLARAVAEATVAAALPATELPATSPPAADAPSGARVSADAASPSATSQDPAPAGRVAALRAELDRAEGADEALRRLADIVPKVATPAAASEAGPPAGPPPAAGPARPQAGGAEAQDATLAGRLGAARDEAARLRDRLAEITRARASRDLPSADLLGSGALADLLDRYAGALAQRDRLGAVLGPRHPAMRAAAAEVAGLRRQVARELGRLEAGTAHALARAKAAEADLARQASAAAPAADTRRAASSAEPRAAADPLPPAPASASGAASVAPDAALARLRREAGERRAAVTAELERASRAAAPPAVSAPDPAPAIPAAAAAPPGVRPALTVGAPGPAVRRGWMLPGAIAGGAALGLGLGLLLLLLPRARGWHPGPRGLARASGLPLLASLGGGSDPAGLGALQRAVADAVPEAPPRIVLLLGAAPAGGEVAAGLARLAAGAGRSVLLVDADDDLATRALAAPLEPGRRLWSAVRRTALRNLSVLVWSAPFIGTGGPDDRGGTAALRAFATEHDIVLVHAPVGRGTVHLRPLAAAATTLVLLADGAAASRQAVDALRHSLGPQAAKLAGFAWVAA